MAPGEQDPFLQVQEDVQSQLQTARGLFSSYLRIFSLQQQQHPSSSSFGESPELISARSDLLQVLEDLKEDVTDLADAVRAAERDPSSFRLDGVEVSRRKRLVASAAAEVDSMTDEVEKSQSQDSSNDSKDPFNRNGRKYRNATDGGQSQLPDPSAFDVGEDNNNDGERRGQGYRRRDNRDEDYAAEFEQQTQELIMREQNEQLDSVYVTVGNLRNMADDMGRELHEQTEMLDHTDRLADRVGERLQTGMENMKHIIRKNEDGLSSCCIAVLITVLIILLVLLLIL